MSPKYKVTPVQMEHDLDPWHKAGQVQSAGCLALALIPACFGGLWLWMLSIDPSLRTSASHFADPSRPQISYDGSVGNQWIIAGLILAAGLIAAVLVLKQYPQDSDVPVTYNFVHHWHHQPIGEGDTGTHYSTNIGNSMLPGIRGELPPEYAALVEKAVNINPWTHYPDAIVMHTSVMDHGRDGWVEIRDAVITTGDKEGGGVRGVSRWIKTDINGFSETRDR